MSDYIPPELIRKILEKSPVRSLLRFTTVCKSWYDLIKSSSFISSHLKNQESSLLISHKTPRNLSVYSVYSDDQTFDKLFDLYPPLGAPLVSFQVIGTFNGLCSLFDSRSDRIVLWNPSIRESLVLLTTPRVFVKSYSCIGFCFVETTDDYKIVRVSYDSSETKPDVEIYELKIGTWRNLDVGFLPYVINRGSKQVVLNGILHWVVYKLNGSFTSDQALIGSFDMINDKFGSFRIPDRYKIKMFEVHTFQDSLCVTQFRHGVFSVWVMKEYGVADSWENRYNFDNRLRAISSRLYFRKNGNILILKEHGSLCSLICWDLKRNEMQSVGVSGLSKIFHVDSYVESLVLINSSKQVRESAEKRIKIM